MEQSVNEAWKRLLDEARRELPEATVRTWLEPSEPIALDEGRLILGAPDQFAAEWNESKHASLLARAAERVLGRPTAVVFRVQEDRQRRPQMDFFVAPPSSSGGGGTATASSVATTPLNERYLFQTFVIGKSNELAAAAAHGVAEAPGKTYNPLFIYGATGLGKTHLMQAIAHAVLEKNPETRPHDVRVPPPLPQRRGSPPGGRRPFPGREGNDAGGILPHVQCAVRGAQTDRAHLGPPAQGDSRPRRPADLAVRMGDGRRHRASRSRASHRDSPEEGGAGSSRAHDSGRRAALHRRAHPLERARAGGVHHQAVPLRLAQEPRGHDRAGP